MIQYRHSTYGFLLINSTDKKCQANRFTVIEHLNLIGQQLK